MHKGDDIICSKRDTKRLALLFVMVMGVMASAPALCVAQIQEIDSLKGRLAATQEPAERISIYNELAYLHWNIAPRKTEQYADSALQLARQVGVRLEEGHALRMKGIADWTRGHYEAALRDYIDALAIFETEQDSEGIGDIYNNIGIVYYNEEEYEQALDEHRKALNLRKRIGDRYGMASSNNNLGLVAHELGDFEAAIRYHGRSLTLAREVGARMGISQNLSNIGRNYLELNRYDSALVYNQQALTIRKEMGDRKGEAATLVNLGNIHRLTGNSVAAEAHFEAALEQARSIGALEVEMEALEHYSELMDQMGKMAQALFYFREYTQVRDSLHNIEKARRVAEVETEYGVLQKEMENKLLRERGARQAAVIRQKNLLIAGSLLFVGILGFVTWSINRNRRRIRKAKGEIERQADKITRQNDEITRQKTALQELNTHKDMLLSVIGHDLRGPVGNIRSMLNLIKSQPDDMSREERDEFLRMTHDAAGTTYELLDNLLFWARSQREEMSVETGEIAVEPVVDFALKLVAPAINQKSITIARQMPEELSLCCDQSMFETVIRNLLSNAIKFTPRGGTICFRGCAEADDTGERVQISVQNSGRTIPERKLKMINNGEILTSTPGTAKEKGTGMGLALCHTLLEMNDGTLKARNITNEEIEKGVEFRVTLPGSC